MNLAILIGRFPPGVVGGAEIQAQAWTQRLSRVHRVVVITRRDPPWQPAEEEHDGYRVLRLKPIGRSVVRTLADLWAIDRTVQRLSPRPDLLLCFQTFISGLAGVRVQRRTGAPAVIWVRGEGEYRLGRSRRARFLHPRVWAQARGVLVQSESNRAGLLEEVERRNAGWAQRLRDHIDVVPNGLELPAPPFAPGRGVLAVGRLIYNKGMDVLLEAGRGMGTTLTFVGDGPEREALERRARALGVDARFLGALDRPGLEAQYRAAACVVLAARRGEGLPNVLLEAMSFGRPVVASDVGGVADLVRDGENGLLVPPADPAGLRNALNRLMQDGALANRLAAAARKTAEEFAWDRVYPRLEAVLERWGAR